MVQNSQCRHSVALRARDLMALFNEMIYGTELWKQVFVVVSCWTLTEIDYI